MKIKEVNDEHILFDNGTEITFDHEQDCCECNYADFKQLDSIARDYEYNETLIFEALDKEGFLFGDNGRLFFVPCYSEQNGYYTDEIDIYLNGKKVLHFDCEARYDE